MDPIALGGVAIVLLIKESGVPIPVPGDLIVIGTGAALAGDPALAAGGLVLILLVGYVGGSAQFLLMRGAVRRPLLAMVTRLGIPRDRVDGLAARLRQTGFRGVAVARMTPGVRVGAIAACGLAALPFGAFVGGLVVGNGVFVTGHFALGYLLGASAGELLAGLGGLAAILVGLIALAVAGAIGWILSRRRRGGEGQLAFGAWADAACPACLTVPVFGLSGEGDRPGRAA
jgi:membrane protein DedA with SNARE-associated domain